MGFVNHDVLHVMVLIYANMEKHNIIVKSVEGRHIANIIKKKDSVLNAKDLQYVNI